MINKDMHEYIIHIITQCKKYSGIRKYIMFMPLTWNKHINHISMKIARSIGILYRLRNVYPEFVLLTIYNDLILPHSHYCLLLWVSIVKENHSLHLLQKKALTIINNSDYWRIQNP